MRWRRAPIVHVRPTRVHHREHRLAPRVAASGVQPGAVVVDALARVWVEPETRLDVAGAEAEATS